MSVSRESSILKAVAGVVREQVQKAYDALSARLSPLEAEVKALRSEVAVRPEKGDRGEDGRSVTAEDVLPDLKALVHELAASIPTPKDGRDGVDGKSVTLEDVAPLVEQKYAEWALSFERQAREVLDKTIDKAVDRIPPPVHGRDGKDGADGRDGKDADPEVVAARVIERLDLKGTRTDIKKLCQEMVEAQVALIPVPKDGRDGVNGKDAPPVSDEQIAAAVEKYLMANPPKDGRDGIDGKDGADGADGKDGRDGIDGKDGADGVHGKDGADGINGKDGADGVDGKSVTVDDIKAVVEAKQAEWALDFEKRAQDVLQKAVDRMPKPKDGKDGFSLKDFTVTQSEDGREVIMALGDGEHRHESRLEIRQPIYKQVWQQGEQYYRDDFVTWGGSMWAALKDTKSKPGEYNKDWRLCVKSGRNGRDAK